MTTITLVVGGALVLGPFLGILLPDGQPYGQRFEAALLLGLLAMPVFCCAFLWLIHLRQKRRGQIVFGWVRFVVMGAGAWGWFLSEATSGF